MYGPHYPLHNERYFKSKVLPKLLDEKTQMFRFYSCKFRIEKSKLRAARVVLFKEYGIMNCFTLEASFHGFINRDRNTEEFTVETLEEMGHTLGIGFSDYLNLVEDDDRQKAIVKEQLRKKKTKMRASDIQQALIRQENSGSQAKLNQSDTEKHGCASDSDVTSTNSATAKISKLKAVRSVSI